MNRIRFVKILSSPHQPPGPELRGPICELTLGLLPFSDVCLPELTHVRRCACGNWVEEGNKTCPSCEAPGPQGPPTRAWKRMQVHLHQLDLNQAGTPFETKVPRTLHPDSYLAELEAHDDDVDWEASDDERN
jgi:hypothetical protein